VETEREEERDVVVVVVVVVARRVDWESPRVEVKGRERDWSS